MSDHIEQPGPLEHFTTEELWEELSTRFRGCCLVYSAPMKCSDEFASFGIAYSGGFHSAVGLLSYGHQAMLNKPPDIEVAENDK
jgi:hypothetical protein